MATPDQLAEQGDLLPFAPELEPDELPQRLVYALPRVRIWTETRLVMLQTDGEHPGASSPLQQADALLSAFVAGEVPGDKRPHIMLPEQHDIWVLRTFDLRYYGWFWRPRVFILSAIAPKADCIKYPGLASGFVNQAVTDRMQLDLDEPKVVKGGYNDFF